MTILPHCAHLTLGRATGAGLTCDSPPGHRESQPCRLYPSPLSGRLGFGLFQRSNPGLGRRHKRPVILDRESKGLRLADGRELLSPPLCRCRPWGRSSW